MFFIFVLTNEQQTNIQHITIKYTTVHRKNNFQRQQIVYLGYFATKACDINTGGVGSSAICTLSCT